jgi:hypothetical protein
MAAENNLWQTIRPRLQRAGFFCQRIETSTGEGVPDVWIGKGDDYIWIENKAIKEWPKRESSRVFGDDGLRTEQVNWHIAATQKRIRACILAGVGVGAKRQLFLVPSRYCELFNLYTKRELEEWACSLDSLPELLRTLGKGRV